MMAGHWQILIVLLIILILFGGKKLPELAHSLGKSIGEFKKGKEEGDKQGSEVVKNLMDEVKKEIPSAQVDQTAEPAKSAEKQA
ncbi:MAG: twin-arginine translocase TatA/TatE family subunit [Kiritimatiellae bacterium]|nr:twin-arginine translocase TatA/TatE family subunit [Kiritimatiellia bacterium]